MIVVLKSVSLTFTSRTGLKKTLIGEPQTMKRFSTGNQRGSSFIPDFDPKVNYYGVLGITDKATDAEIKRAFYALAKKYHPDSSANVANEEET